MLSSVREQYERFPYPPIPWLALPSKGEGRGLAYAYGRELVQASPFAQALAATDRPRILVAGCGTFEPVVAAMANPDAAEIVAVDLSATSLERLEKRLRFASVVSRWSSSRRRALNPPLRLVRADLFDWEDGQFDFIIASNVLHHVREPDLLLRRLAGWLGPGGLLRMVTYAQHSRLWLRKTGAWLGLNGVTSGDSNIVRRSKHAVDQLPRRHPVHSCFYSHLESGTATGIVDAFLHLCENPLAPLDWGRVVDASGLCVVGEAQHALSRSTFLHELVPRTRSLNRWQCLQVLDDLLELAANPIYWFVKGQQSSPETSVRPSPTVENPSYADIRIPVLTRGTSPDDIGLEVGSKTCILPSMIYGEIGAGLRRARDLLASIDVDVVSVLERLEVEVGPRTSRRFPHRRLFGLTVNEYDRQELLRATEPWHTCQWQQLQLRYPYAGILWRGKAVAGNTLAEQALRLQLEQGPFAPELEISLVART